MRIEIENLWKTYGKSFHALQDVNLDIGQGMFGLLGPNGAGKSTLMKILSTLEVPTRGKVMLDGIDINGQRRNIRQTLGYLPQFFGVYPQLTGTEFLRYVGRLNGVSRKNLRTVVDETLQKVALQDVGDRKVKTYSGGMVRRLGIAQALIGDPKLLIVDEPTVGLDPAERIRFRNLLADISRDKIIILSTHIVGDISSTCEDLALLSRGRLVFRGRPSDLVGRTEGHVWTVTCTDEQFLRVADEMQVISSIAREGDRILRVVGDPVEGIDMIAESPNLEDAYMLLTKGEH